MQSFEAIEEHFKGDKIVDLMVHATCKIQAICFKVQKAKVHSEEKERVFDLCVIRQRAILHCGEGQGALDHAKDLGFKANAAYKVVFDAENELIKEQEAINKANYIPALQLLEKAQEFLAQKGVVEAGKVFPKTDEFEPEKAHKIVWELASYEKMFAQVKLLQVFEKDTGFVFKREAGRPKDAGCFSIAEDSD